MRRRSSGVLFSLLTTASLTAILLQACGGNGDCDTAEGSCFDDVDGGGDGARTDGTVVNPDGGGLINDDGSSPTPDGGGLGSCDAGCAKGALCKYETCVPDLGSCTNNDGCPGDSYCDTDKTCVPYGVPPSKTNDPTCQKPIVPENVLPTVQCEWPSLSPDAGTPFAPNYTAVYTTPVVADLNLDLDPLKLQPSVVLTTWLEVARASDTSKKERIGILRVFDGRTCEEQMHIGDVAAAEVDGDPNRPAYGTQIAIGDLDGDVGTANGHPEIVALHRGPGQIGTNPKLQAIAYGIDTSGATPQLVRKWVGHSCYADGGVGADFSFAINTNEANYGPGIWDLDDDGKPEVVVDQYVFDSKGCLLNETTAVDQKYLNHGMLSTVADVDLDGKPDLVRGDGIYGWNSTEKKWELKPYFNQTALLAQLPGATKQPLGHVAIADLGAYSVIPGKSATDKLPEVIVTSAETTGFAPDSTGTIRVQTITGEVVFGPIPLFHVKDKFGGHGGAPTAGDFDGDGQVEFAAAANEFYVVYDPDCDTAAPDAGITRRPGGKCNRPANMTAYGPTATVDAGYVYAPSSNPLRGVLWAQPSQDRSSSETGSSVFDFNGDGQAEAVYRDECYLRVYKGATGEVLYSAPASSGTGQEEPVICDVDGDFATEIVVARATNSPTCPATDPLFPGSGTFFKRGGFEVLRDSLDRWASSRAIWNQHAYDVTNVTENASIPKSSARLRNWEQPTLNNFRQNSQGNLSSLALADLTVQMEKIAGLCSGQSGTIPVTARVCNRGTNPVQDGATIAFYAHPRTDAGVDAAAGTIICSLVTPQTLSPSACVTLSCTGTVPANQDVYVVADPENKIADCHPNNNDGASARALCAASPN